MKGYLALLVITGFFAVLLSLGLNVVSFDQGNQSVLVLVGALSGAFGQVISWYFGSSEGSSIKTGLLVKKQESGFASVSLLLLIAALSLGIYGCAGTPFEVRQAEIPVDQSLSEPAQLAQKAINEANVNLAAVKMLIADKVANEVITADEAQSLLDKTREYDRKVDAAQALLDAGDPGSAQTQVKLIDRAILVLQREVSNRAKE